MHGRPLNAAEPQPPLGRLSLMDEAAVDAAVAVTLLMVSISLHQAQIVAQVLEKNEDRFMASSHSELNSTIAKILAQNHLLPDADGPADDDDEDAAVSTAKGGKGAVVHEEESTIRSRALSTKKAGRKVGAKVARPKRVHESSDNDGDDAGDDPDDADEEDDAEEEERHAAKRQKTAPARSRR